MSSGNPHFLDGLLERRRILLERLQESPKDTWSKVMAKFAFEFGLTKNTVQKYFDLLMEAGLLEETE